MFTFRRYPSIDIVNIITRSTLPFTRTTSFEIPPDSNVWCILPVVEQMPDGNHWIERTLLIT